MKLFLYSLVIFNTNGLEIDFKRHQSGIFDYSEDWIDNSIKEKPDLRTKFLENRRKNIKSKQRLSALTIGSYNVEYSEGIPHYATNTNMNFLNEIKEMEDNFKSMLNMNGVKYDYKRDMHWRTWREVTYPNKSRTVICYRCENIVRSSCETCHNSGTWAIDENLQCPYEIFSLKNKGKICAFDYRQLNTIKLDCPMTIKLSELRHCNNPLETKYLIKRDFNTASKRNTVMCQDHQDRGYCEILTIYMIAPNGTTFRIINSTNHVIYSRIMKPGGKIYVCIEDCGFYDHILKKITTNGKPFLVNLLDKAHKNKREYWLTKKLNMNYTTTTTNEPINIGIKIYKNANYEAVKKRKEATERRESRKLVPATTLSGCQKIKMNTTTPDYGMEEYYDEFLQL